jgi:hypothetical protein
VGKRKQFIEFSRIKQDEAEVSLDARALGLLIAIHVVQFITEFLLEFEGPICGIYPFRSSYS